MRGIEPRAFHMQSERSTTELHPLLLTEVHERRQALKKNVAPGEARTHGLQIMRLTRCLLRYGGTTLSNRKNCPSVKHSISIKVEKICTHGGTRTPNLRFRRPTPYPLGHAGTCCKSLESTQDAQQKQPWTKNWLRRPGIEPGSQEWESCMIPLHQRRTSWVSSQLEDCSKSRHRS